MEEQLKKCILRLFTTAVLLITISFAGFYPAAASAANLNTIIVMQNGEEKEYNFSDSTITYNEISYHPEISPVLIDAVWMIPLRSVLSDILQCHYEYNSEKQIITLRSPAGDTMIQLTVDSEQITINDTTAAMPCKLLAGSAASNQETEFLLPMDYILETLGFVSIGNIDDLTIESDYIYSVQAQDVSFDTANYRNAFYGFAVTKSSKYSVRTAAVNQIASSDISFKQNAKDYIVTIKYKNTKNLLGTNEYSIKKGPVVSVSIKENSAKTTCVSICYSQKYIYTQKTSSYGGMISFTKGSFSMKAALPDNVKYSKIKTTDQYWKNKFLIVIPGNYVSFYKKYPPFNNSSGIKKIAVTKTSENNTKITVTTVGLKGYQLSSGDGFFTVKIGAPSKIYDNIIMLDAGHGGKDYGAVSHGVKEKDLNLSVLYTYAKTYFDSTTSNVKAYWTRYDDTFINLYERPKYSAKYNADLFLSLHMNSSANSQANGTEVYYSSNNNTKNASGFNSKLFAKKMQAALVGNLNTKDRGVNQAGFVVIKNNTVPAILVELGFVSGNSDRAKLKRKAYQKQAAKVIYEEVEEIFKKYYNK
ncbi:MAG: N-acetylmuramoyl-L-alanine amidase [Clostridiaceae bacterium]|nr:N-acetylmuramoyl-L-alanine amidase [Clostridiaceae bacterium]